MKSCRHSGQVISNGDGLHPVKILDDLHAKSVKEFEDQKMCPYHREGKGMPNLLRFGIGRWGMTKSGRLPEQVSGLCAQIYFFDGKG